MTNSITNKNREQNNFFLFIRYNPLRTVKLLLGASQRFIQLGFHTLIRRFCRQKHPPYLKYVYKQILEIKNFSTKAAVITNDLPVPLTIKLVSQTKLFDRQIDWSNTFADPEDFESLHRWSWLIGKLSPDNADRLSATIVQNIINDWIIKNINVSKKSLIWNTYTTAERICNAIIFCAYRQIQIWPLLTDALAKMTNYVFYHLEYYGRRDTFNHLINNCRALYFFAGSCQQPIYAQAALTILTRELPSLITKNGFWREGSTHYHFLCTSWLLEIYCWAKKFYDPKMQNLLQPFLKKTLAQCWFFLEYNRATGYWQIPLIGDISPDCPPGWLLSVPFSQIALTLYSPTFPIENVPAGGWSKLFKNIL